MASTMAKAKRDVATLRSLSILIRNNRKVREALQQAVAEPPEANALNGGDMLNLKDFLEQATEALT